MLLPGLLLLLGPAWAADAPCITGTAACQEKVVLSGDAYSLVYRSFPLHNPNPSIERAFIVVHGAGRNADNYFVSAVAGAFVARKLDSTLVIAPRLASDTGGECQDKLAPGEISWTCSGAEDWRGGGASRAHPALTTFHLIDEIIRLVNKRDLFPNLKTIVLTGHSAGGQFTHRYAAASRAEKQSRVPIRYVVANPSTYLYLDDARLRPNASCTEKDGCSGSFVPYSEGRNCTTYNRWRNGLDQRAGYAASVPDAELKSQLAARDVTYLLGELDTTPKYGFDGSCPAMAQGPDRLARGIAYFNYITSKYHARHKLIVVPACGHNGRCMYTADAALPVLFP
jgi:hypothetical protein